MPDVPAASRPKILIVDDEPYNVDFLEQELDDLGYDTVSAFDGGQALAQVRAQAPDLVLLDIMMPEMDGYETAQAIRATPGLEHLPIISLTAKALKGDKDKALAAGASDYIAKPVDVDQLITLIRAWLGAGEPVRTS